MPQTSLRHMLFPWEVKMDSPSSTEHKKVPMSCIFITFPFTTNFCVYWESSSSDFISFFVSWLTVGCIENRTHTMHSKNLGHVCHQMCFISYSTLQSKQYINLNPIPIVLNVYQTDSRISWFYKQHLLRFISSMISQQSILSFASSIVYVTL